LMFGRAQGLLHEIYSEEETEAALASANPRGSADCVIMRDSMVKTMTKAYELVRKTQQEASERNRLRRKELMYKNNQEYEVDEMVYFWEPQQRKILGGALRSAGGAPVPVDENSKWTDTCPSKWTPNWTGPHKIVGRSLETSGYRYSIFHIKRAKKMQVNANRLCRANRWNDEITSTSAWLDGKQGYEMGGRAEQDALIVVPSQGAFRYGIAKVTAAKADGAVEYQWMGNVRNQMSGSFLPGWSRTKQPTIYYNERRQHHSHKPYWGHVDVPIRQKDIILHSFKLTNKDRLPANVRRAIATDDRVGGS
jgi:hypothetical protein